MTWKVSIVRIVSTPNIDTFLYNKHKNVQVFSINIGIMCSVLISMQKSTYFEEMYDESPCLQICFKISIVQ